MIRRHAIQGIVVLACLPSRMRLVHTANDVHASPLASSAPEAGTLTQWDRNYPVHHAESCIWPPAPFLVQRQLRPHADSLPSARDEGCPARDVEGVAVPHGRPCQLGA
jgi:hypothetical protein